MTGIAVIGAGHWGKNLVRNFDALPGADLRYVCDRDPRSCERMRGLYPGVEVTEDMQTVLSDAAVDAVVIAVIAPGHYEVGRAALEAGKHVFIEKPLALSAEHAVALDDLARDRGLKLMVGHLLEYHPAIDTMKQMLASGDVGDPLYMVFQRLNLGIVRPDENAWWSLAPHDISVACYLFDAEPVSVSASGHDTCSAASRTWSSPT